MSCCVESCEIPGKNTLRALVTPDLFALIMHGRLTLLVTRSIAFLTLHQTLSCLKFHDHYYIFWCAVTFIVRRQQKVRMCILRIPSASVFLFYFIAHFSSRHHQQNNSNNNAHINSPSFMFRFLELSIFFSFFFDALYPSFLNYSSVNSSNKFSFVPATLFCIVTV